MCIKEQSILKYEEPPIFCFFFPKKENGTQILLNLTSEFNEVV